MNDNLVIRIHRSGYDPAKLTWRVVHAGDCLEPWLPDGSWGWYERDAAWADGDICLLYDSRRGGLMSKAIYSVPGDVVLCSNMPATRFRPEYQTIIGVLAVSVVPPSWYGHPFAEESEEQRAKNAAFRQGFADYLRGIASGNQLR